MHLKATMLVIDIYARPDDTSNASAMAGELIVEKCPSVYHLYSSSSYMQGTRAATVHPRQHSWARSALLCRALAACEPS